MVQRLQLCKNLLKFLRMYIDKSYIFISKHCLDLFLILLALDL